MARLFVMRHARTPSQDFYWGTLEVPLCAAGIESARRSAASLRDLGIETIAHSPQLRAEQTALIVRQALPATAVVTADPRLAAKDYGVLTGLSKAEVAKNRKGYSSEREILTWMPERGESYWMMFLRVTSFITDAARSQETILAITHESVAKILKCLIHHSASYLSVPVDYEQTIDASVLVDPGADHAAWLGALQIAHGLSPLPPPEEQRTTKRTEEYPALDVVSDESMALLQPGRAGGRR